LNLTLLPRRAEWATATRRPATDLMAGLMVGLVALPLALGFGVSSGMGAGAGLVTAIVAGIVAAVFGGSNLQVSGPTGAMTVVLVPIIAEYGGEGVLVVGLLAGLILVATAFAGLGKYIRYVPIPVVEGFTLGIAVIIALQQVPAALGVHVHAEKAVVLGGRAVASWLQSPEWAAPALTASVTVLILLATRLRPSLPVALLAVTLATGANAALGLHAETIGVLPSRLPAPSLPTIPWAHLDALVLPAIAVAALAGLESLLSATVADAMSVGQRHDPDRELFGQGLANLASPLFGGIPATAAIARTAVNVRAGASTRLAAVTHGLVLLVIMLVASRWVAHVPIAALAGVLVATATQMVRVSSVAALFRATRGDAAVLVITAAATVTADLVTAVILGLVVAGTFALRQAAQSATLEEVPLDRLDHGEEERAVLDEQIVVFRLDGPLFFAAAHDFLLELSEISDVRVVVLRMSRISTIDATGASVLADAINRLEGRGITVLLSGVRAHQEQVLSSLGVYDRLASEHHLFASTPEAIAHARVHAARMTHDPRHEVALQQHSEREVS